MCPISRDYVRPVGSIKADNVTFSWSLYNGVMPKLLISWSQALPGNPITHNVLYHKLDGYVPCLCCLCGNFNSFQ